MFCFRISNDFLILSEKCNLISSRSPAEKTPLTLAPEIVGGMISLELSCESDLLMHW